MIRSVRQSSVDVGQSQLRKSRHDLIRRLSQALVPDNDVLHTNTTTGDARLAATHGGSGFDMFRGRQSHGLSIPGSRAQSQLFLARTSHVRCQTSGVGRCNGAGNRQSDWRRVRGQLQRNGGAETITFSDDGDAGDGESVIDSTLGELVTFAERVVSLTINAGDGNESVDPVSVDSLFDVSVIVNGDDGNDVLNGGGGNDLLVGTDGSDNLVGGDGRDVIAGYGGEDTIDGGQGNDTLVGGVGNDSLLGGPGDDLLAEEEGRDTLNGNNGNEGAIRI